MKTRPMINKIHPIAGAVALATILIFWSSTVLSELFASEATIVAVKTAIPWGFLLLVPAIAAAGGSGMVLSMGARSGLVGAKFKRMPFIGANGVLVLIPSALFLASKAKLGAFDTSFYVVQGIELVAGAVNLSLLGMSMRDGLKLTGRLHRTASGAIVKLISRDVIADGTMAFRFSKPAGFKYAAGQSISISLIDPPETDDKGLARVFTIASAPHESELMVATRMRDTAFKRVLSTLPVGSAVRLTGPSGEMTFYNDLLLQAAFLAGGIGITPFLAMARHAAYAKLPQQITLFYSIRNPDDAAFLDELRQLEKLNPNFRLVATITDINPPPQSSWSGEYGHINKEMLGKHSIDMQSSIFFIAGPPAMTLAMRQMLKVVGVPEKNIRFEEFYGY